LRGISLVRRNSEWHHFDPLGTAGVITNGSASVVSNNLYDAFGVLRYTQGSAQTPWRWKNWQQGEEGLAWRGGFAYLPRVSVWSNAGTMPSDWQSCVDKCSKLPVGRLFRPGRWKRLCELFCSLFFKKPKPPKEEPPKDGQPQPKPEPTPGPPEAYVKCEKGECRTQHKEHIATCCPSGIPYCGPPEGYAIVCGGTKPPNVPAQ